MRRLLTQLNKAILVICGIIWCKTTLAKVHSGNATERHRHDAILTAVRGMSLSQCAVFVRSWYRTAANSELFVFTEIRPNTRQSWADYFSREHRSGRFHIMEFNYSLWTFNEFQMDRHLIYLDFLKHHGNRFRYVLTADIRDVVFQSNPFDNPYFRNVTTAPMVFAQEDVFFGYEMYNAMWIRGIFGDDALPNFLGKQISNSGVVMGPAPAMVQYLSLLTSIIPAGFKRDQGMDQGVHNYIVHEVLERSTNKPFNYVLPSNGVVVFTVGTLVNFEDILGWNDSLKVAFRRRWDLAVPPVVHQFDRHAYINTMIQEHYSATSPSV
eukprot:gene29885-39666_t